MSSWSDATRMDRVLWRLPTELGDKIARLVHEMNMQPVFETIKYRMVFTVHRGKLSFLVCESQNYYLCLHIS